MRFDWDSSDDFSDLVGKTVEGIDYADYQGDRIVIRTTGGDYVLYHAQQCCERVSIEEIHGDPNDLRGAMILLAEESSNQDGEPRDYRTKWTFYKIQTDRGDLTIRWCGSDNGYYSVSVSFGKLTEKWDPPYDEPWPSRLGLAEPEPAGSMEMYLNDVPNRDIIRAALREYLGEGRKSTIPWLVNSFGLTLGQAELFYREIE